MESDIREDHEEHMSSDLARYRSAPSSYFSNFAEDCGLERVEYEEYLHNRRSSPETDGIMARFISEESTQTQTRYELQSRDSYSRSSPVMYQSTARPPLPSQNPPCSSSEVKVSYGAGEGSNLMAQGVIRGIGSRGQISFSSIPPSSSEPSSSSGQGTYQSVPVGSWEVPSIFSEDFSHLRRAREADKTKFSCLDSSESQLGSHNHHHHPLSRHSSLPVIKTSVDMGSIDSYFQFQDSVPCKVRAKRGCATHPRSIAERVRRTRISERMRKLQELVPNMDKQTSTADMLDLAVDYIKDLQKQVKILSDTRARCTCLDAHSIIQAPT